MFRKHEIQHARAGQYPLFVSNYSMVDRLLHRLALNSVAIAEMSFDFDQVTIKRSPDEILNRRHVFVSGLARSGSTVLMRQFYATGQFVSLTYRDMPFVLAPNIWRLVSRTSRRDIAPTERAHGDTIPVGSDSPESLDEVFWRIFAGRDYISNDGLKPHSPSQELLTKYIRYVNAILSAQGSRTQRYLSKNNNNILRLGAIHRAFPHGLILIPFRDPLQQAQSLFFQHVKFSQMQSHCEFILNYMTWLGHHEFGLGHRPFRLKESACCPYAMDTLNYWLHEWCEVYSWLAHSRPEAALFVCYEDLCSRPQTWKRLMDIADSAVESACGDSLKLSTRLLVNRFDAQLANGAMEIYTRLVTLSRNVLG